MDGTPPPGRTGSKGISPAVSEHSVQQKGRKHAKSFKGVYTTKAEFSKEPEQIQTQRERGNISFGLLVKSFLRVLRKVALVRANHALTEHFPKNFSSSACTLEAQKGGFPR